MPSHRSTSHARVFFIAVMLFASACLFAAAPWRSRAGGAQEQQQQQQQVKRYKLYCVKGKLEIGIRAPDVMKRARGNEVCLKESFNKLLEAKKASKQYGGVGSACTCSPNTNTE